MGQSRLGLLGQVYKSWGAKLLTGFPIAAGAYQFACDQFGFPTIPAFWGMTGAAIPWWAWLLFAQLGLLYGLFEYVRRNATAPSESGPEVSPIDTMLADLEAKVAKVEARLEERLQLERLESTSEALQQMITGFSAALSRGHELAAKEPFPTRGYMLHDEHFLQVKQGLTAAQNRILKLTGTQVDLLKHPNFTENPMRPRDGCHQIKDERVRADFRRTCDQLETALRTIGNVKTQIDVRAHDLRRRIFGRED